MNMTLADTDHSPYFAALARMIRAAGRRVAQGDADDLGHLVNLRDHLDEAIRDGVAGLRDTGVTWQSIGECTGTTRQAAIMKWGRRRQG